MTLDELTAAFQQAVAQGIDRAVPKVAMHLRHQSGCGSCTGERCGGLEPCTCDPAMWLLGAGDLSYRWDYEAARWSATGEPYPGPIPE